MDYYQFGYGILLKGLLISEKDPDLVGLLDLLIFSMHGQSIPMISNRNLTGNILEEKFLLKPRYSLTCLLWYMEVRLDGSKT